MPYKGIALTGPPGSGTTTLSKALPSEISNFLAQDTLWDTHSTGGIIRQEYVSRGVKEPFDIWWPRLSDKFLHEINTEARRLLITGNIVLDSRYALKNAEGLDDILTIFIDAPVEIRADRVSGRKEYSGMTPNEIISALENRKQDEIAKGHRLFGYDYTLGKYDLRLDSEKMSVQQELEAVLALIELGQNI